MTEEERCYYVETLEQIKYRCKEKGYSGEVEALDLAIKVLDKHFFDKSAMMYDIFMEGVNMTGEFRGCWVRFKNIEKIVDKYIPEGR